MSQTDYFLFTCLGCLFLWSLTRVRSASLIVAFTSIFVVITHYFADESNKWSYEQGLVIVVLSSFVLAYIVREIRVSRFVKALVYVLGSVVLFKLMEFVGYLVIESIPKWDRFYDAFTLIYQVLEILGILALVGVVCESRHRPDRLFRSRSDSVHAPRGGKHI